MNSLKKKSKNYKYKIKHHNKQKGGGRLVQSLDYPGFEKKIEDFVCAICQDTNTGPLIQTCVNHVVHLTCFFKIRPFIDNATLKYNYIVKLKRVCPYCQISDDETFASSFHTVNQANIHYLHKTGTYLSDEIGNTNIGFKTILQHPKNEVIFITEEICDNIILQFDNIKNLLQQYINAIPDNITTEENPNIDLNRIISMITNISNMHTTSKLKLSVNSLTIKKPSSDSLFNFYFNTGANVYVCQTDT